MRKYWSAAPTGGPVANISFRLLALSRRDRLGLHRRSERFKRLRTPVQEYKVCEKVMVQSKAMCDEIMSILSQDVKTMLSWGTNKALGVSTDGRIALVIFVDAFKHRGPVAIYPTEHSRFYDVEVQDFERHVLKSVECVPAESLVENIDRLVEVTEHYFDDLDRWLLSTPSDVKTNQQLGRILKRCPEAAAKVHVHMAMMKR